jgi:hypothetical protein
MYVSIAGVVRPIAAILAGRLLSQIPTANPNKNIARHKRAKNVTARQNGGDDYGRIKKPWMMHLQHPITTMLLSAQIR